MTNPVAGQLSEVTAWCDPGEQALGGGFTFANETQHDIVQQSNPVIGPTGLQGWHVTIVAMPPLLGAHGFKAYAQCVVG